MDCGAEEKRTVRVLPIETKPSSTLFKALKVVGRAGFEPATHRFLLSTGQFGLCA